MSKRKRPDPQPSMPQSTPQLGNHQSPRPIVRYIASSLVALHFAALIVALSANLVAQFSAWKITECAGALACYISPGLYSAAARYEPS